MPLTWAQVRSGLDSKDFTIRTAPALIAKSRAWADYGDSQQPLQPAIERLTRTRAPKSRTSRRSAATSDRRAGLR